MLPVALALIALVLIGGPALAEDWWLTGTDENTLEAILGQTIFRQALQSDWGSDFSADWGGGFGADYTYSGQCTPSGNSWKLRVTGTRALPKALSTPQPFEPGNFTNRVGKPVMPPWVTGINPKVGIQSIPDTEPLWYVWLSWNCPEPMPTFGDPIPSTVGDFDASFDISFGPGSATFNHPAGFTMTRDNTQGSQGGPYGPHF